MNKAKIAIFVSGKGTNAQKIIQYFQNRKDIEVSLVCSNNPRSEVLELAQLLNINQLIFNKETLNSPDGVIHFLNEKGITHIVLAGFLWLVPASIIGAYNNKIINIHPALLPKYGGKGMFGMHVHQAVKDAQEKETGITIHLVNERYDEGKYLFQEKVELMGAEAAEEIAKKVQELEHQNYPPVIERWILES
jgi:phosphoribosylglycinamide formyltransferase 1